MELRPRSTFFQSPPSMSLGWNCKPGGSRRGRKPKARKNVVDFGRTVEFNNPTFACDFMSQLYALYQQGICCDVVLSTGDYETSTHKVVLMASSEYFKSLFLTPDLVKDFIVLPPDVSSEALKSVMSYMYTGLLYLNLENVQLTLITAEQLQIKSAVELCHQFLNYSGINLDTSLSFLASGTSLQLDQVNDVVIKEEIPSFEEAEIESKVPTSELLEIQAIGDSFTAVRAADSAVNGMNSSSKKRTKSRLNQENTERSENVYKMDARKERKLSNHTNILESKKNKRENVREMNARKERKLSNHVNILESKKAKRGSAICVPTPLRCDSRVKGPPSSVPGFGKRGKRGPYKKRQGKRVHNPPKRNIIELGQMLLARGTKYKCNICGVGFRKYSGLIVHMRFIHRVRQLSLAIRTCRKLLRSVILRVRRSLPCESHLLPPEGCDSQKVSCLRCPRTFCLRSRLSAHLLKCHSTSRPIVPEQKKTSFSDRVKRSRLTRARIHKCRFCKRPFSHESVLDTHCLIKHKRIKREPCTDGDDAPRERRVRVTWTCKEIDCGITCSCIKDLKKHMATKHPNVIYSCPDCRFSCQVEKLFQRHRNQRHGKRQICDLCGKACPKLSLLKQHMYIHHKVIDPTLKLYQCAFEGCTYECCSKHRLADHCSRHNLDKSLKCEECGKAFKHTLGLQKHVNTIHHGIRPFICDQCGMAFGTEGELKSHVSRHSKSKPFECSHCSYRTRAKVNLQSHLFSRHKISSGLKEQKLIIMKCDQCNFSTSRKGRLEDHIKKHQNIRDIPCPECGKLFITKKNLYGHTVTVHRPKTLQCTFCNYSSALLSAFKDHVRIMHTHRHEKLYECPICRFRSATSGNCRKHIQHKHREFEVDPKYVGAPRMSDAFKAEKDAAQKMSAALRAQKEGTPRMSDDFRAEKEGGPRMSDDFRAEKEELLPAGGATELTLNLSCKLSAGNDDLACHT